MNRSNTEELIGVLWLILSAILYQGDVSKIYWITPLVLGLLCQWAAIIFALREGRKKAVLKKAGKL